jgi:heme A synthase
MNAVGRATVLASLKPIVAAENTNILLHALAILAGLIFWLWTPRIMFGPRVPWRSLVPIAALTTFAVTLLAYVSPL